MSTMKAVTVYGPQDARMEIVPKPVATDDMVLIKVLRTGVCATDQSIYTGESSFVRSGEITYPCRFGHEFAGIVDSIGPNVTRFQIGDRVYTDNFVSCGICDACQKGDYMSCSFNRSVGTVNCWDGCYAEYMEMPERHVFPLPNELSMDEGALIEPASISYDVFKDVKLTTVDTVVVFGTGAIGMIAVWLAKYYGAGQVILVGRTYSKLDIGKQIGADIVVNSCEGEVVEKVRSLTGGLGASLVVETSGASSALRDSLMVVKRFGRVSVVSFYEHSINNLPIDSVVLGCITLKGAAGCQGNAPAVCEIMRNNPVKLTPIITHHVPFEDCLTVFENESEYHKTKVKAMIVFDHNE